MHAQYLSVALVISGAAALSVRSPLPRPFATLRNRQTAGLDPSDIPAQCQTPCGPVVADLQTCTNDTCVCTASVRNDYQTCLNCFGSISTGNANLVTAIQAAATDFNNACSSEGFTIIPLTVPGGTGGGATSVGSGAASATGVGGSGVSSAFLTSTGIPTGTGTFLSSGLPTPTGGLGGGALSTDVGAGGGPTQTAATVPAAGGAGGGAGTALGAGAPSSTGAAGGNGVGKSAGYKASASAGLTILVGMIGVAACLW